jgi:hypothetical protein
MEKHDVIIVYECLVSSVFNEQRAMARRIRISSRLQYGADIEESGHCPRRGDHLAPRHLLVLLPLCSAIHVGRASLFFSHSIQLCGHELPEARVFTLYLLQVVPMSKDYHNNRPGNLLARGTSRPR